MIPGVAGTQTTPRAVGLGRALDLVLTGRWLDARAALSMGIVGRVVPRRRLDATARALARRLAVRSPAALAAVKRAVDDGLDGRLDDGLALESRLASAFDRAGCGE
jgi:enoyl-CoA hydratase/carnithine racemase